MHGLPLLHMLGVPHCTQAQSAESYLDVHQPGAELNLLQSLLQVSGD